MKKYLKYAKKPLLFLKKHYKYVIVFFVCLIVFLSFLLYPRIKLTKQNMEINVGSKYKDPGYKAYNLLKKYNNRVQIEGEVNTKKIGTYKIKYSYNLLFIKASKIRTVKVVDKEPPKITLEYEDESICKNKYKEYKYKAEDNYDGDLTKKVNVELKEDKLVYTVTDSSGNNTVLTKKIKIITDNKPEIKLKGSQEMILIKGNSYNEPGYEASDKCDDNLTDKVKVEGIVNKDKVGTYELKYTVMNSNEIKTEVTRKIIVRDQTINSTQTATNGTGKVVYLTFDDGPGAYTKSILNTLDKYGVKATFFVTNQFPAYQNLISEEAKKGHVVAVHTYSHKYSVYSSVDAYINDFNQMNEIIKNQTGSYSNIFRFPGGSSNTISKKYSTGVVSSIAAEMSNRGYAYFDWNVSSGDAGGANATGIYNNVINGVSKCGASCVVLMHDIKGTTATALDPILAELKRNNYKFGTLSTSSPVTHHKINN